MSKKSNNELLNELESKFRAYKEYDGKILKQEQWLASKETNDENSGGGRSSFISKPTEHLAIKFASDDYIQQQHKFKKGITETLCELSENERVLIERKYWGDCSWMNWTEFGKEVGFSTSSVSRLKQKVLMNFGRKINRIGSWE